MIEDKVLKMYWNASYVVSLFYSLFTHTHTTNSPYYVTPSSTDNWHRFVNRYGAAILTDDLLVIFV